MTTDTVGGVWTYTLELCRALRDYNYEIHLLALGAKPDEWQIQEIKGIDNVVFYPGNLKLEWMENPWADVEKTNIKIETLCKIIEPDLFHFNNYVCLRSQEAIQKVTVFHSCVQTWWLAVKQCEVPTTWNRYVEHLENACNASNVVIFPTDAIRREAYKVHAITAPYDVIYNGRTLDITENVEKEKIIFCTGRIWDEAKNLMMLCELASQLPWPVYVAGNNANPNTAEKVTLNNIRFLGKLNPDELQYWLERTEIYVNPALYEPFGLAVLEAAKMGCALVLSDITTLQEVWQENAVYFDPRKENELEEAILKLINDDMLRKSYKDKAQKHSHKYQSKDMANAYDKVYKSLLKKKTGTKRKVMASPFRYDEY